MQYYKLTSKKHHFLVTPDELRKLLSGFHHVVITRGVAPGYTESDPNELFSTYDTLYHKLKSGEKLIWENDHVIADWTMGITQHLENCVYRPGRPCWIPDFTEPCPFLDTFCFLPWKDQLSTAFAVHQFPENICGLCLYFESKVEYKASNEKHTPGVADYATFDDYEAYEQLLSRIRVITKPLKLDWNGKIRRTAVRVSPEAKKDLENFYFVTANSVKIL